MSLHSVFSKDAPQAVVPINCQQAVDSTASQTNRRGELRREAAPSAGTASSGSGGVSVPDSVCVQPLCILQVLAHRCSRMHK